MGKMKEIFTQQMEDEIVGMSDAEYQDWLHSQKSKPVTQEEKQSQHDDWWNSLTDEEKQKLYEEAERAEEERIERELEDRAWSDEI
jgi:heme/copper-type cytochrome/quinol oxidase subunit 2